MRETKRKRNWVILAFVQILTVNYPVVKHIVKMIRLLLYPKLKHKVRRERKIKELHKRTVKKTKRNDLRRNL